MLAFTAKLLLTSSFTSTVSRLSSISSTAVLMSSLSGNLVSVEKCLQAYHDDKASTVVFVDGSWHLSADRDGRVEYEAGPRIVGAKFFDIDDISSKDKILNPKALPHMMPPKELFASLMDTIKIKRSDNVIIYGTEGCMSTARTWYQFRAMGHPKLHVMQGSLKEWQEKGGPIETGRKKAISAESLDLSIGTMYQPSEVKNIANMDDVFEVVEKSNNANAIIVDARSTARFHAKAPEPRPGVRGGHIPGSFNVPSTELIEMNDVSKLIDRKELKNTFEKAGINVNTEKNIICSCGSGVMACILALALEECGREPSKTFVYDGSWSEWATDPDTPIEE